MGTNGGGPELTLLDSVVVFRVTPGIDGNFGLKFFSVVDDSASVLSPSLLYPGGKSEEISSTSDGRLSKKDSMGNLELSGFLLFLDGGLLVDDSVPAPSFALYPGGKNALASSNLIDPNDSRRLSELELELELESELLLEDVEVVLPEDLLLLNNLGGLGRADLKLKSLGKRLSSISMLDKISEIKLVSVVVLVVVWSMLNPGGKNADTSS